AHWSIGTRRGRRHSIPLVRGHEDDRCVHCVGYEVSKGCAPQKPTQPAHRGVSALPPKADMRRASSKSPLCAISGHSEVGANRLAQWFTGFTRQGGLQEPPQTFVVQCLRGDVRRTYSRTHSLQLFRKFVGENFELVNLGRVVKRIT